MIIADTEELRSFILDKGVDPARVITIHSGVRPKCSPSRWLTRSEIASPRPRAFIIYTERSMIPRP